MPGKFGLSVFKNNRLFSLTLFFIYFLVMSLLVMLVFFYPSVTATFDTFLEEYRLADLTCVTTGSTVDFADTLRSIDGVSEVSARMLFDAQTVCGGRTVSLRYQTIPDNDFSLYYQVETKETVSLLPSDVFVSYNFAKENGLSAGSEIRVWINAEWKTLTVTGCVSCPETIGYNRDALSFYDNYDFGYVFIGSDTEKILTGTAAFANRFDLLLADTANTDAVLSAVREEAGDLLVSADLYEGSVVDKQIHESLDSTKPIVTYLPALISVMGILFSTLFMAQIIRRSAKTIGLLRALGYHVSGVCRIFIGYSLYLTLTAAVLGCGGGYFLLTVMLDIYRNAYDLPRVVYTGNPYLLLLLVLAVAVIGIISCLLCTKAIAGVDPATAYGGVVTTADRPLPHRLEKAKLSAFAKIGIAGIWRNRKRVLITVLCNIACLILTMLSFAILQSKETGIRYTFEERWRYQLLLTVSEGYEDTLPAFSSLDGVADSEPVIAFTAYDNDTSMHIEAYETTPRLTDIRDCDGNPLSLPSDNGILLEEGMARRIGVTVGDTVTLDGVTLTVEGITREYFDSTQYISKNAASAFGYSEPRTCCIRLTDGTAAEDVIASAAALDGYGYAVLLENRERCAKSFLQSLDAPCYLFVGFAVLIGAVIVANINIINLANRRREYATLLALGTGGNRFWFITVLEASATLFWTLLIGLPLATVVTRFFLQNMSGSCQEYVLCNLIRVIGYSVGTVFLYLCAGVFLTVRAIRHLPMLSVLNERSA